MSREPPRPKPEGTAVAGSSADAHGWPSGKPPSELLPAGGAGPGVPAHRRLADGTVELDRFGARDGWGRTHRPAPHQPAEPPRSHVLILSDGGAPPSEEYCVVDARRSCS